MKKFLLFAAFTLMLLCSSWALFHQGFFRVHDFVHAARIAEMWQGLREGQLPVRWTSNFGFGYGMPLYEFYAPLPYFIGAVLFGLGLDVVVAIKILYILANALTLIGAFFLGKKLYGKLGGVVTAVTYTLAPYRAVNLFVRGAVSEAWAMIALPWIVLGLVMMLQRQKYGSVILFLGLITLFLSHNLTTLLFVPISVLLGISLFFFLPERSAAVERKTFSVKEVQAKLSWLHFSIIWKIIGIYSLAIGTCAFYLLPAIVEKDFTKIGSIFTGYFHYSLHFLYIRQLITPFWGYGGSGWGPDDGLSFFLGYGQLFGFAVAGFMALMSIIRRKKTRRIFWMGSLLILIGGSVFMTLLRSKPLWDAIPLLTTVQFPWRWLSIVSFLIALLSGAGVALIANKRFRIAVTLLISFVTISTTWNYFKPEAYMDDPTPLYYTDPVKIQVLMSDILPDYIPKEMDSPLPPRQKTFVLEHGDEKDVVVQLDLGHRKIFKTSLKEETTFNPLIASYPGRKATHDGQPRSVENSGLYGTLAIKVPAGEHVVEVWFGDTPVRAVADAISGISILIILGVAVYGRFSRTTTDIA